jgi:hypothetical protein
VHWRSWVGIPQALSLSSVTAETDGLSTPSGVVIGLNVALTLQGLRSQGLTSWRLPLNDEAGVVRELSGNSWVGHCKFQSRGKRKTAPVPGEACPGFKPVSTSWEGEKPGLWGWCLYARYRIQWESVTLECVCHQFLCYCRCPRSSLIFKSGLPGCSHTIKH